MPYKKRKAQTKIRLRVQELAGERGIEMSVLARRADIGMTTMRRVWHNSATGSKGGEPLESVNLKVLEDIADVLGVEPGELLKRV
jgi:DNA-binding Xre family transcriptional regulator